MSIRLLLTLSVVAVSVAAASMHISQPVRPIEQGWSCLETTCAEFVW